MSGVPNTDSVRAAYERIAPYVRHTPILAADPDDFGGTRVTFKLELLQHAGSFKPRGAFSNLLSRSVPKAGVTAASGGNHGIAVALAAAKLGHSARIFVPEISSPVKIAAIESHGAHVVVGGARYADAQVACDRWARDSGALLVHPYDAPETIAGAGTVALEWEDDVKRADLPPLDVALVGVGGGGLLAGAAAYWQDRTTVVGVEPAGSRCLHAALVAGEPVDVTVESVAADALGARRVGDLPFAIARKLVREVALVEDDAIRAAQAHLWRRYRIAAEPAGAAALSALMSGRFIPARDAHVGILVCGSNVDLTKLNELTALRQ